MLIDNITSFNGEYSWLSNFSPSWIDYDGYVYPTVEHAYQASKTLDITARTDIRCAIYPGRAKKIGRYVNLRPDWENVKLRLMEEFLIQKFNIPEYKNLLLGTGDVMLYEGNTWGDDYWGVYKGKGENHLGKLIMKIRERIKNG